jgi:hypothetical protein
MVAQVISIEPLCFLAFLGGENSGLRIYDARLFLTVDFCGLYIRIEFCLPMDSIQIVLYLTSGIILTRSLFGVRTLLC